MKRLLVILAVALTIVDSPAVFTAPTAAELDAMLAPIALYPDQLLAQMLLSASNPGRIATLSEWLRSQGTLKGTELQNAAAASGFPDSYVALVLFPDVVDYMAGRMDWTTKLGQAFAADRSSVFASIQRLRAKAKAAGTLKTTPQQQVETKTTSSGEQVIVIEPSNPQVVYVPQYNAQTVYTQPSSTTVVVQQQSSSSADAAVAGMIGFTAGVAIGAAFDNHYYGPYGWYGGGYMYNDAWDDYYDAREDAREDWQDHREDMYENRSDRAEDARENRSDRAQNAQQSRTDRQQNRASGTSTAAQNRAGSSTGTAATTATQNRTTSQESRGYSRDSGSAGARDRSGTKSDAFSGYSSGRSERASSQRGQRSRSSSRSGGSRRR